MKRAVQPGSLMWLLIRSMQAWATLCSLVLVHPRRQTNITKDTPVDAVVMAVIDLLEVEGKVVFRKS